MADPAKLFEKEAKLFESKKTELLKYHPGKFVAIHGDKVLGVYDSDEAAIKAGFEAVGAVPIFVRRIDDEPDNFSSPALTFGLVAGPL